MITYEALKQFCSVNPSRIVLAEPFNFEQFTIATCGRLLVRVPRHPQCDHSCPITEASVRCILAWLPAEFAGLVPMPALPSPVRATCERCKGTGLDPNPGPLQSEYHCQNCGGEKTVDVFVSVPIGKRSFNNHLLAKIATLPAVQFMPSHGEDDPDPHLIPPIPFIFDGGVGLLMPMRQR